VNSKAIFENLMKNKKALQDAVSNKGSNTSYKKDETFWNPPWDATKKIGIATIAFLPFKDMFNEVDQELSPYIFTPIHTNLIGKNGKKYININCPSGKKDFEANSCPICNKFFELFNGSDADKLLANELNLGRKRYFCSNIMVLKNDSNPEEVGKVFKWKFGWGVQQKINSKINPIDGDEPVIIHNPFDITPFKVKIIEKAGFRNYDTSEWGSSGKTIADYIIDKSSKEDKLKYINDLLENNLFEVKDFINDKDYRSNDDLLNILNDVLSSKNLSTVKSDKKEISENAVVEIKESKIELGNELDNTFDENLKDITDEDENSIETSDDDFNLDDIFNDK